ncbi:MAG: alpha/beta hydrolase [Ekhidna sp.]|nr:alpha/beta hydrolase [Ekhidna sp.]MBC6410457.1 alpha/beta hydrolase [Ekhidna sp.]MBC6426604.1 alpha/beta hydrolase [Ekhidna sp.]
MKSYKVILIHGNQTLHWGYAWLPWLKNRLKELGIEVIAETFPDSIIAREKYWVKFLEKIAKADENTILVGHSSGALCAMRYAEKHQILGTILVSAAHTDLGDELEKQSGYFNRPWDWETIKKINNGLLSFHRMTTNISLLKKSDMYINN